MNICRICLSSNIFKDIQELSLDETNETPEDIMKFSLDIDVTKEQHITKKLCENCHDSIINIYNFKTLAQKSYEHLIELFSETNEDSTSGPIKLELDIDDDDYHRDDDHENDKQEDNNHAIEHDSKINTAVNEAILDDDLSYIIMISEDVKKEIKIEKSPDDDDWGHNYDIDIPFIGVKPKLGRPRKAKPINDTKIEIKKPKIEVVNIPQECQLCGKFVKNLKQHSIIHSEEHKEKRFKCKTCNKSYVSIVNLRRHEVKHDKFLLKKNMKECTLCGKSVRQLNAHMKMVHNQDQLKYECATCNRKFMDQQILDDHMYHHTGVKRHECDHCKKKFRTKGVCENHIRAVHLKERSMKCPQCPMSFFKKYHLDEHLKNKHKTDTDILNRKRHVCSVCGSHVRNLKQHMQVHKSSEERDKVHCVACNKAFYTRAACKRHFKLRHLNIREVCPVCNKHVVDVSNHIKVMHNTQSLRFVCSHEGCDKRFISATGLDHHMAIHSDSRPFECNQCLSTYKTKDMLNRHVRSIHKKEKNFLCQVCSKGFFKKYALQVHLLSHTDDRPHECEECGKGFKTIDSLRKHLILHSGVKNHVCVQCKMEFAVAANLRTHMLTHTRERKFPCEFCGMKFTRKDHRKTHENRAHFKLKEDKSGVNKNNID